MDLAHWLWLATAAYGIHVLEEFVLDWRDWARSVIGLPVDWKPLSARAWPASLPASS
jgi:hypothetical protein